MTIKLNYLNMTRICLLSLLCLLLCFVTLPTKSYADQNSWPSIPRSTTTPPEGVDTFKTTYSQGHYLLIVRSEQGATADYYCYAWHSIPTMYHSDVPNANPIYNKSGIVFNTNNTSPYTNVDHFVYYSNHNGTWHVQSGPITVTQDVASNMVVFDDVNISTLLTPYTYVGIYSLINGLGVSDGGMSVTLGGEDYIPDAITKRLYLGQQINFKYSTANASNFLSLLDTADGVTLQTIYSTNGVASATKGAIYIDNGLQGELQLSDIATPVALTTNEIYSIRCSISMAGGGNHLEDWIDITFDANMVAYNITNVNSGAEVSPGNFTSPPAVSNVDAQGLPGIDVYPDEDAITRANYAAGIEGTVNFYMDKLFNFIAIPLRLLQTFFVTIGNLINLALATASSFISAFTSLISAMPPLVSGLLSLALYYSFFKLVFNR